MHCTLLTKLLCKPMLSFAERGTVAAGMPEARLDLTCCTCNAVEKATAAHPPATESDRAMERIAEEQVTPLRPS